MTDGNYAAFVPDDAPVIPDVSVGPSVTDALLSSQSSMTQKIAGEAASFELTPSGMAQKIQQEAAGFESSGATASDISIPGGFVAALADLVQATLEAGTDAFRTGSWSVSGRKSLIPGPVNRQTATTKSVPMFSQSFFFAMLLVFVVALFVGKK